MIKNLPTIEKVKGKWVVTNFAGSPPAWNYPKFRGKAGTLYVLECASILKIGMTARPPHVRLRAIDTSCPLPLRKVRLQSMPLAGLAYAESYLHHKFKDRWVKGEWYDVPEAEVISAIPGALARARAYEQACYEYWCDSEERKRDPDVQARLIKAYEEYLANNPLITEYELDEEAA